MAIRNPVVVYLTIYTLPNFPYPIFFKILKFSHLNPFLTVFSLIISLGFDLIKAGEEPGET